MRPPPASAAHQSRQCHQLHDTIHYEMHKVFHNELTLRKSKFLDDENVTKLCTAKGWLDDGGSRIAFSTTK